MPAAADLVVADVPGMPEEFTGPVAYSDRWLWIGLALLALVVLYYLASWWFTRPPRPPAVPRREVDVPDAQRDHLARIDALVARVRAGEVGPRDGHQQLSELVRSYVATVTTLPARTMALADFRDRAPQELVDAIELMYPPEFAPDAADTDPLASFDDAVDRSRRLVGTWG
ncbi:hypothetical protein BJ993_003190 [Nocardioides aromaticivorans]|uniref:Uncharacterized protein n=1 Tax=Nocardioides aromaticivorans TaxID=200618 RepID=A0A7Z0CPN4_9ACTN|nr:hypothetical protein [Nocardioides aromaticivorans]NYI46110.1 hypothetical protein [Nocardioides aromaticivorans]